MNPPEAHPSDPTLEIARRQLVMLTELAEMGMAAARAFNESAVASAKAEAMILAEEYFTPEVGRAKACGARDAAESLQKVQRAVRLTLVLQMKVAEIVRDINAGKLTHISPFARGKDAGETPDQSNLLDRRRPAGSFADRDIDHARDSNAEPLAEFERPDTLGRAPCRDTIEHIREDIGAAVDRTARRLRSSTPPAETPPTDPGLKPPGRSPPTPGRPPG